jgi:membrane protein YqaA with SNARE-associated domain
VLGALLGYAIGFFLFERSAWIISLFGYGGKEAALRATYDQYGVWSSPKGDAHSVKLVTIFGDRFTADLRSSR